MSSSPTTNGLQDQDEEFVHQNRGGDRMLEELEQEETTAEYSLVENPSLAEGNSSPVFENLPPPPPLPPSAPLLPAYFKPVTLASPELRNSVSASPQFSPSPKIAQTLHPLSPSIAEVEKKEPSPQNLSPEKEMRCTLQRAPEVEPFSLGSSRSRSYSRSPDQKHSPAGDSPHALETSVKHAPLQRSLSQSPRQRHSSSQLSVEPVSSHRSRSSSPRQKRSVRESRQDRHSSPRDSITRSPSRSPTRRSGRGRRSRSRSPTGRTRRHSPRSSRYSTRDRDSSYRYRSRDSPSNRGARSPPTTGIGRPGNNLFVAGLSFSTTERDLEKKFARYGRVTEARIIRDKRSGSSRGFGFLSFEYDEDADAAIRALDQTEWNGRRVMVEKAKTSSRY